MTSQQQPFAGVPHQQQLWQEEQDLGAVYPEEQRHSGLEFPPQLSSDGRPRQQISGGVQQQQQHVSGGRLQRKSLGAFPQQQRLGLSGGRLQQQSFSGHSQQQQGQVFRGYQQQQDQQRRVAPRLSYGGAG